MNIVRLAQNGHLPAREKQDETIPGGAYWDSKGILRNANGDMIDTEGAIIGEPSDPIQAKILQQEREIKRLADEIARMRDNANGPGQSAAPPASPAPPYDPAVDGAIVPDGIDGGEPQLFIDDAVETTAAVSAEKASKK